MPAVTAFTQCFCVHNYVFSLWLCDHNDSHMNTVTVHHVIHSLVWRAWQTTEVIYRHFHWQKQPVYQGNGCEGVNYRCFFVSINTNIMLYYYICNKPKQHLLSQDYVDDMKAWNVFGSPMCDCFDGARDVSGVGRALRHGGVEPHLKRSGMRWCSESLRTALNARAGFLKTLRSI